MVWIQYETEAGISECWSPKNTWEKHININQGEGNRIKITFWWAMHHQLFLLLNLGLLSILNDLSMWNSIISRLSSPGTLAISSSARVPCACILPCFGSLHSFYLRCPCSNLTTSSFMAHLDRSYPLCSISEPPPAKRNRPHYIISSHF